MARVVCKGSTFTWNSASIGNINEIQIGASMEVIDVTDLASTAKEVFPCGVPNHGPFTCSVFLDPDNVAHKAMVDDMTAGTSRTLSIALTGSLTIAGTAFITDASFPVRVKDLLRMTVSGEFSGAVTYTFA